MQFSINTNPSATQASLNLSRASEMHRKSLARLSSGQRIVNPADDAGGLAVGNKLDSKLARLEKVGQNLKNTSSFLELQESALAVVGTIITRMSELKTMATDVTKNSSDVENYNKEFVELQKQIEAMTKHKFNGVSLFSDTNMFAGTDADGRAGHGLDLARNFVLGEYVAESGAVLGIGEGNVETKVLFSGSTGTDSAGNKLAIGAKDSKWDSNGNTIISPDPSWATQSTVNAGWLASGNRITAPFQIEIGTERITIHVDAATAGDRPFNRGYFNNKAFALQTPIPSRGVMTTNLTFEIDASGVKQSGTLISNDTFQIGANSFGFIGTASWDSMLIDNMIVTAEQEVDAYPSLDQFTTEDFTNFTQSVASAMAEVGSHQSRLNMEMQHNETARVNLEAAKSRIMDADMAQESTRFAKTNVLVQSSASMVAQANQLSDIALRLMVNR